MKIFRTWRSYRCGILKGGGLSAIPHRMSVTRPCIQRMGRLANMQKVCCLVKRGMLQKMDAQSTRTNLVYDDSFCSDERFDKFGS